MKIMRIEHVAIAVNDMGNMTAVLRDVLGLKLDYTEEFLQHKTRVALFPLGDSAIELVQGLGPEARSAKWVAERGQSLFHICLEVEDIDSALDELRGKGIKLIHDTPVVGHGQCRIAFIDPSCTGNILFELAEPPRQEAQ
jgi:methylmalonyl-CoA/ethylmalonyl-CoA epimerase